MEQNNNYPTVVIGCPVRNRAWVLPYYLDHIYNLDYPKKNIIPMFIINDSTDDSDKILMKWQRDHYDEYKYIVVSYRNLGQIEDKRVHAIRQKIYSSLAALRNVLLSTAMVTEADYLFSVDSDILVPPNALKDLLDTGKDIIAAHIWNDTSKKFPNFMVNDKGSIRHLFDFPRNSLFQCDVTGAVYLLSKKAFSQIRYGYHAQGEDVYFCQSAKKLGFEIWVNPAIYCNHIMNESLLQEGFD